MFEPPKPSEPTQPYATARSAAGLAILSVLSPIGGIAVEVAVATRFGTSAAADAFRVALAVVYTGQQFFIGSLFPNIFVPLFAEYKVRGEETEAWRCAITLTNLVLLPTLLASALLFMVPGKAVWIMAPGLGPAARQWAMFFMRWFGLSLIPLLYTGAVLGLLYAHRIFWTAAAAQLVYSIVLTASIVTFGGRLLGPTAIAIGVLLGLIASLLVECISLAPVVGPLRISLSWGSDVADAGVRKGIRLGIPLLSSPLITQASGIIALWSLSAKPVGTIAALGYAGKLLRMVSLLPDVMATVLFPKFATMADVTSRDRLRDLSTRAIRMALFIALPMACVLFALRIPVVVLLFRHGVFSESASVRVGFLFGLFLVGMPAGVLSVYLAKVLYALEDMWWPTYGSFASVAVAVILMPAAAASFGAEGVAAAYAAIFWVGTLIQAAVLHWKYAAFGLREFAMFSLRIVPLSAAAAWLGGEAARFCQHVMGGGTGELMLEILSCTFVAAMTYWLTALFTGTPEALVFSRYLQWQTLPVLDRMRTVNPWRPFHKC